MLLIILYAAFIGLGLPSGLLGAAWPVMQEDLAAPVYMAGVISAILSGGTILSTLMSDKLTRMIRPGYVVAGGLLMIVLSLLGFSLAGAVWLMCLWALPLGLGSGAVDAVINNYIAVNYSSRHMNWLHCFWGMGGAISPIIMSQMILFAGWRTGYVSIVMLQGMMAVFVLVTLLKGVWVINAENTAKEAATPVSGKFLVKKRYARMQIAGFLIYAGFEYAITFWTVSVMLEGRGLDIEIAGLYPAVYLGFMTGGRFVLGYVTQRFSNTALIRFGLGVSILGLVMLSVSNNIVGMALIGFGFGPVFPCLMHETSRRYSPEATTKLVGYQIAAVGVGVGVSTFGMGRLLEGVSLDALFPAVIVGMIAVGLINEVIEGAMRRVR